MNSDKEGQNRALEELYQELLLDHFRSPRNKGEVANPASVVEVRNPLCGDVIRLSLRYGQSPESKNIIEALQFTGSGCSISQASASMLTSLLNGKTFEEAKNQLEAFTKMLRGPSITEAEREALGDAASLEGVKKFSARLRCALLAWDALDRALKERS